MLREVGGAAEVHVRITAPPVRCASSWARASVPVQSAQVTNAARRAAGVKGPSVTGAPRRTASSAAASARSWSLWARRALNPSQSRWTGR